MRARFPLSMAGLIGLTASTAPGAHHSISAQYFRGQSVTVEGTVVEFVLRNPHSEIRLRVGDAGGATAIWTLEMDDAEDIRAQGIEADTIRPGDIVVATGNPARDGSAAMFVRSMHRPADGLDYYDD